MEVYHLRVPPLRGFQLACILTAVVVCCCHRLSAEDQALKADLEHAFFGKAVVSKLVFGGKAKPSGQWMTFPVNTLVYPNDSRVTFRVESGTMRTNVRPREMKQQFDQGTSFRITAVDLKDNRLELTLKSDSGDFAKLKLMLGAGWQSKFDISSVQKQFDLIFAPGQEPEPQQRKTTAQRSVSDTAPTIGQQAQQEAGAYSQDATALEAQYKTCAKHYIPTDKCTLDIYRQLKERDEAPLDPLTASALQAVRYYQTRLKNPASLQVRTAYITDKGDICLEVGGQNGAGGMTISNVAYTSKGRWLDEGGLGGSLAQQSGGGVNRWQGVCTKGTFHPKLVAGTDVTEKVNQALNDVK